MTHYYIWHVRFIFVLVFTLFLGLLFLSCHIFWSNHSVLASEDWTMPLFNTHMNYTFGCEVGLQHCATYDRLFVLKLIFEHTFPLLRRWIKTLHEKRMSTVWCAHNLKYIRERNNFLIPFTCPYPLFILIHQHGYVVERLSEAFSWKLFIFGMSLI